jgi:hypothetical protein
MNAKKFVAAIAVVVLGACTGREPAPMDASLSSDLALAASSQPYQPQQYVSPVEQGYAPTYAQPAVYRPQPAPSRPRQSTTARAPQPTRIPEQGSGEVIRNTKRDAVIGATAGAVIGATTSRDKVKGAVIGAAVGGVLGGIVGHTIDVERPRY